LRDGITVFRELGRRSELKSFVAQEFGRVHLYYRTATRELCAQHGGHRAHPFSTCKMGADSDAMAAIDDALSVRGVEALRVVDASVFPDLVRGKRASNLPWLSMMTLAGGTRCEPQGGYKTMVAEINLSPRRNFRFFTSLFKPSPLAQTEESASLEKRPSI
jgi:GMC oxidoreductase